MSDLAPFVAATIRDKVVVDLKEENDQLREQLRQRWAIEITGTEGAPVYARGQFNEGEAGQFGNPNLWDITLSEVQACPLASLGDVEVHVGGIMKATFGDISSFEVTFDVHSDDHDDGKCVHFCFAGGGKLWLTALINGWPRDRWQQVAADENLEPEEQVFQYLTQTVAAEQPNKMVSFKEMSFFISSMRGAIRSLSLEETVQQETEENRVFRELYEEIATRMRAAGYEGNSYVFVPQLDEVADALARMGMDPSGEQRDGIIDRVIALHRQTRDNTEPGEGFEDIISRMIQAMEEDEENAEGEMEE